MYGIETATTLAATGAGTAAEVTATAAAAEVTAAVVPSVLEVTDVLGVTDAFEVADALEVKEDEPEDETEVGVPAGQSEPASAGGVHGIISK